MLWIITDAERLAQDGWVDASAWSIGFAAVGWARENLERYLRGDSLPDDLGEPVGSYKEAWDSLQEMIEHQIEAREREESDGGTTPP